MSVARRLYLNLVPESLVVSMLDPESFGNYLAVGLHGKTRGQAMFFEVGEHAALAGAFPLEEALERCERESKRESKHSI